MRADYNFGPARGFPVAQPEPDHIRRELHTEYQHPINTAYMSIIMTLPEFRRLLTFYLCRNFDPFGAAVVVFLFLLSLSLATCFWILASAACAVVVAFVGVYLVFASVFFVLKLLVSCCPCALGVRSKGAGRGEKHVVTMDADHPFRDKATKLSLGMMVSRMNANPLFIISRAK
jgi:hypothetical protein